MSVKSSVARTRFTWLTAGFWRFEESISCANPGPAAASWPSAS
jgi:hypothetical protein